MDALLSILYRFGLWMSKALPIIEFCVNSGLS